MKFKQWLDYNKEGVIGGAIVGALLFYFNPSFLSNLNLPELAWHRLSILVLISSSIGALIDSQWRPRK